MAILCSLYHVLKSDTEWKTNDHCLANAAMLFLSWILRENNQGFFETLTAVIAQQYRVMSYTFAHWFMFVFQHTMCTRWMNVSLMQMHCHSIHILRHVTNCKLRLIALVALILNHICGQFTPFYSIAKDSLNSPNNCNIHNNNDSWCIIQCLWLKWFAIFHIWMKWYIIIKTSALHIVITTAVDSNWSVAHHSYIKRMVYDKLHFWFDKVDLLPNLICSCA